MTSYKEAAFRSWWDQRLKEEKLQKEVKMKEDILMDRTTALSDADKAAAKAYVDFRYRQCLNPSAVTSVPLPESGASLDSSVTGRTDAVLRSELNLLQIQIEHAEERVQELRMANEAARIGADRFKELNAVFDMKVKDSQLHDRRVHDTLTKDEKMLDMLQQIDLASGSSDKSSLLTRLSPNPGENGPKSGITTAAGEDHRFLSPFAADHGMEDFEEQLEREKTLQLATIEGQTFASQLTESPERRRTRIAAVVQSAAEKAGVSNQTTGMDQNQPIVGSTGSASHQFHLLELRVKLQKALSEAEMNSPMINYPALLNVTSELSQVKHKMAFDRKWCELAMNELVHLQQSMEQCVKERDQRDQEYTSAASQLDHAQRDAFATRKEITLAHRKLTQDSKSDLESAELLKRIKQELAQGSLRSLNQYIEQHIRGVPEKKNPHQRNISEDLPRTPALFQREPISVGGLHQKDSREDDPHFEPAMLSPQAGGRNTFLTTPNSSNAFIPKANLSVWSSNLNAQTPHTTSDARLIADMPLDLSVVPNNPTDTSTGGVSQSISWSRKR